MGHGIRSYASRIPKLPTVSNLSEHEAEKKRINENQKKYEFAKLKDKLRRLFIILGLLSFSTTIIAIFSIVIINLI